MHVTTLQPLNNKVLKTCNPGEARGGIKLENAGKRPDEVLQSPWEWGWRRQVHNVSNLSDPNLGGRSWIPECPFPGGRIQHPHGSRIPLTTAQLPGASDTPISRLSSFLPNPEGQSWRKQVGKDVPGGQEVSSITEEHAVTIAEVTEEEPSLVCSINPDIISCYLTCWSSQQHQEHGLSRLLPARRGHTRQFPVTPFAWQPLILPIFMAVSVRWCPLWTIQTVFKIIMEKEKTKR